MGFSEISLAQPFLNSTTHSTTMWSSRGDFQFQAFSRFGWSADLIQLHTRARAASVLPVLGRASHWRENSIGERGSPRPIFRTQPPTPPAGRLHGKGMRERRWKSTPSFSWVSASRPPRTTRHGYPAWTHRAYLLLSNARIYIGLLEIEIKLQ